MADDIRNLFDEAAPAPTPITLTFGEEGSPQIQEEDPAQSEAQAAVASAAAAVQEAKDVLGEVQAVSGATGDAAADAAAAVSAEIVLTPEEQAQVDAFAERIDLHNSNAIMQYGSGTQKKMSEFSDLALENVRNKDMGEVGKLISGLVTELKDFDVEEEDKGFFKFFKKQGNKMVALKARYDKTEASVDDIVKVLEDHQVQLLKDVATLDKMYDLNLSYFKELSMYIAAGKKRLAEVRAGELKELQDKAAATGDAQDAHDEGNDLPGNRHDGLIGHFPWVADVFGESPYEGFPAVSYHLRIGFVLHKVEDEREHNRHDGEELEGYHHLVLLGPDCRAKETESLHVSEDTEYSGYTEQAQDSDGLERCDRQRDKVIDPERICGQEINQAIEGKAVPYPAPETFVFRVQLIGCPDAQRNLDAEEDLSKPVDTLHPFLGAWRNGEGGNENLGRA